MRWLACLMLIACGGKQATSNRPTAEPTTSPAAGETPAAGLTPIQQRRDAACVALGPRLAACAVADARHDLEAGKTTKAQFEKDTAPMVQHQLVKQWREHCEVPMSSRQVRVLEVCNRDAHGCAALLDCLDNLKPKKPKKAAH